MCQDFFTGVEKFLSAPHKSAQHLGVGPEDSD